MTASRQRYGSLVSAIGAILLLVAVFLPWYGVSFTAHGVALAQQAGASFAAQFGNSALQEQLAAAHATLSSLVGEELVALSAHQLLHTINVVLLIAGGLACAVSLLSLADASAIADGGRALLLALGLLAGALIAFRMLAPPTPAGGLISLSLREGAWLALLGSAAVAGGALFSASSRAAVGEASTAASQRAWAGLSGWTPEG